MTTPNNPPASDLAALTPEVWARLSRLTLYVDDEDHADLLALFAAYDRQTELLETVLLKHQDATARLAAWEQHQCPQYRQHHQSRLVQLRRTLAERDALAARLAVVEAFVRACQFAGEGGLEQLRADAMQLMRAGAVGAGEARDGE